MSKGHSTNVSSVLIDEKGVFDLNSDHVIISVKLREITPIFKKQDSYSGIKLPKILVIFNFGYFPYDGFRSGIYDVLKTSPIYH
jgi:hypothetical protein